MIITQSCNYLRYQTGLNVSHILDTVPRSCTTTTSEIMTLFSRDPKLYPYKKKSEKTLASLWPKTLSFFVARYQLTTALMATVNIN